MRQEKSIDGLVTRDAKNRAKMPAGKPVLRPSTNKKVRKLTVENVESQIDEDSLNIEIIDGPVVPVKKVEKKVKSEKTVSQPNQSVEDFLKPVEAFNLDIKESELSKPNPKVEKEQKKEKKPKKEKKKMGRKKKIVIGILAGILSILIIAAVCLFVWGSDILGKITDGQGSLFDLFTETYEPLKTDANGRTNILAFGTSGYNMEGEEGNGVHDGAQLTDSIMMISLNQETGDVAMLSLPRDLKASPTCTATGKINEVYWCNNMDGNNEEAGATALMSEVGAILGVDFQYYAHLNWGSLVSIVDTLGGIKVTLDEDISDYYYTKAVFEAGVEYTINGEQALGLARARHGTAGGDFSRGTSQQKILIGIKDKVLEKDLSIPDIMSLASTLGDNLRTNLSVTELKTAAHLATSLDFNSMRQISLYPDYMTTGMINGISYVLPRGGAGNYGAIQQYVATKISNDPRDYEEPTIIVLNATETPGLAAAESEKLAEDGYSGVVVGDAPEGEYADGYTVYAVTNDKPGTKKMLEEHYGVNVKGIEELPEGMTQDYDFVVIINLGTEASE